MKLWLGVMALVLNLAGYAPYIRDVLKGIAKPHRISWGIWVILTTIAAVNQIRNGGGFSAYYFAGAAVTVALVFLLSLKFGVGGASLLDKVCLGLAIGLFVYWAALHNTRFSTLFAIIIDSIGTVPTLVKTFKQPETETYLMWVLSSLGGLLSLLAVPRLDWALLIYPAYVFAADGSVVGIKYVCDRQRHVQTFTATKTEKIA